jgi:hypothetical protein
MRNTIYKIALAAGAALATALIFSCSSGSGDLPCLACDEGGGSDPNLSNLLNEEKQVYLMNYETGYKVPSSDNGNLILRIYGDSRTGYIEDYVTVGRITNGRLSFYSLPNIKSNYGEFLWSFSESYDDSYCASRLNYPPGLSFLVGRFEVNIPGKSCEMDLYNAVNEEAAIFVYFSQSGSITGTVSCGEYGDTWTETWDARNFSEGWNLIYTNRNLITTTGNSSNYEWQLECYGGVDNPSSSSGGGGNSSSSSEGGGDQQSYNYCIYLETLSCYPGPFTSCPSGGLLGNTCPFGDFELSSSSVQSSSSSMPSGEVWCRLSNSCYLVNAEFCAVLGGIFVESCENTY